MSQAMGTLDFFLLEGGEYLERLDALAQTPAGNFGQTEELLRVTRAFRGSAIMASQHGMARAAQGLEAAARAVREGRIQWTEGTRGELIRAVDDCKILMRRLRTPDQGDTEKAEAIGIALDRMSGRASGAVRVATGPGLDAGGRAFVAREAASIASVLQSVSTKLRGESANRDVLNQVAPAMSALRGVAILNDLPPLADVLSAIEHAAKDVLSGAGGSEQDAADMFDAGARALARAAREVVDAGRPDANAEESHAFTARLFNALAGRGGVVSVESLFYDDAGPHIVRQGTAPQSAGAGLARVEMVSHGEYLTAAGDGLSSAETPVQRDLRLYGIAASVRPMMGAAGSPLSNALGRLAEAARDAIARGAASNAIPEFIRHIQQAAAVLSSAQSGDERALADKLSAAASGIASLTVRSRTRAFSLPNVPELAAPQAPAPAAPQPVAASAPAAPPAAASPAMDPDAPGGVLGITYLTLEQLIAERGLPMGTLDELIGAGASAPAAPVAPAPAAPVAPPSPADEPVRISQRLTPPRHIDKMAPEPAVVPVESLAPDGDVVPIESLIYSGESALRRLQEIKAQLTAASQAERSDNARLHALIHEVFDLVELGLAPRR